MANTQSAITDAPKRILEIKSIEFISLFISEDLTPFVAFEFSRAGPPGDPCFKIYTFVFLGTYANGSSKCILYDPSFSYAKLANALYNNKIIPYNVGVSSIKYTPDVFGGVFDIELYETVHCQNHYFSKSDISVLNTEDRYSIKDLIRKTKNFDSKRNVMQMRKQYFLDEID